MPNRSVAQHTFAMVGIWQYVANVIATGTLLPTYLCNFMYCIILILLTRTIHFYRDRWPSVVDILRIPPRVKSDNINFLFNSTQLKTAIENGLYPKMDIIGVIDEVVFKPVGIKIINL